MFSLSRGYLARNRSTCNRIASRSAGERLSRPAKTAVAVVSGRSAGYIFSMAARMAAGLGVVMVHTPQMVRALTSVAVTSTG